MHYGSVYNVHANNCIPDSNIYLFINIQIIAHPPPYAGYAIGCPLPRRVLSLCFFPTNLHIKLSQLRDALSKWNCRTFIARGSCLRGE